MTPIIVAIRAPVLSATSSLERICTINFLLLQPFHQPPTLQFAQRTRFHDPNGVARLRLVLFVVRVKFLHLLDYLAKLRVRHARHRTDHDRFVHRARNDFARARLSRSAARRYPRRSGAYFSRQWRRGWACLRILFGHKSTSLLPVWSVATESSRSGRRRGATIAAGSAARAVRSAVANAGVSFPDADHASSSGARPSSFR